MKLPPYAPAVAIAALLIIAFFALPSAKSALTFAVLTIPFALLYLQPWKKAAPNSGAVTKDAGKRKVGLIGMWVMAFMVGIAVLGENTSTQPPSLVKVSPEVAKEAMLAIRLAGYRCDSIDAMNKMLTATGYSVKCNGFRHGYTITDEGGRMVVRVD